MLCGLLADTSHVEDSALIRLAQIVRVHSYKRRGDHGQSQRVSAYVRKDLDVADIGTGKTLRGAFTGPARINRQVVLPDDTSTDEERQAKFLREFAAKNAKEDADRAATYAGGGRPQPWASKADDGVPVSVHGIWYHGNNGDRPVFGQQATVGKTNYGRGLYMADIPSSAFGENKHAFRVDADRVFKVPRYGGPPEDQAPSVLKHFPPEIVAKHFDAMTRDDELSPKWWAAFDATLDDMHADGLLIGHKWLMIRNPKSLSDPQDKPKINRLKVGPTKQDVANAPNGSVFTWSGNGGVTVTATKNGPNDWFSETKRNGAVTSRAPNQPDSAVAYLTTLTGEGRSAKLDPPKVGPTINRLKVGPAVKEMKAPGEPPKATKRRDKKPPLTPEQKAQIRAKLAKHPVNSKHILAMYDQATDREQRVGREWYPEAHRIAVLMAEEHGLTVRQVAGLIANYSAQKAFGRNLMEANEVARTHKGIGGKVEDGNNTLSYVPRPSAFREIQNGSLAQESQRASADRILAGEDFQDVFAGERLKNGNLPSGTALKIRAFAELIARGEQDPDADPPRVVVDRHAASVARGIRLTDDDYNIDGPSDSKKKFEVYATAYRDAAATLSKQQGRTVTPEEVQAVTWLARQRLNMDDIAARRALGVQDVENSLNYFASYLPSVADIIDDPMVGYAALHPEADVREMANDAVREAQAGDAVRKVLDDMPTINRQRVTSPGLTTTDYEGRVGDRSHITRVQTGSIPTSAIADLPGARGEEPGAHRNRQGAEWQAFLDSVRKNGITSPLFITVDPGEPPIISEGNHRRDAAVELGLPEVPVEIRYFGHAERGDWDPLKNRASNPLVNRTSLSQGSDAMTVLLAKITRVKGYHRRSELGNTDNVQSYVRKQLDPYGPGANAKTKTGAYAAKVAAPPVDKVQPKRHTGGGGRRVLKAKEIVKAIESNGGRQVRQVGSHARFEVSYPGGKAVTVVPIHGGDVPQGTMKAIEKDLAPAFGKGWLTGG